VKTAALYLHGRVVVAKSHLEAYQQLNELEKQSQMVSGFYDPDTKEFCADICRDHFYQKKILLIRHGQASKDKLNPSLTAQGISETQEVTKYLGRFDLKDYKCYVSPLKRCLETAKIIANSSGLTFEVYPQIMETPTFLEEGESFELESRIQEFPEFKWPDDKGWTVTYEEKKIFLDRVASVLQKLPERCILVSHFGVVTNMAKLALCGDKCKEKGVPTASLTFIVNQEVKCFGKVIE